MWKWNSKLHRDAVVVGLVFLGIVYTGCEIKTGTPGDTPPEKKEKVLPVQYSFDEVKLLARGITEYDDPRTYNQIQYTVSPDSHLLMRLQDLLSYVPEVAITVETQRVYLRVTMVSPELVTTALAALKVCPVVERWNIFATWDSPARRQPWSMVGGTYEPVSCVSAALPTPAPTPVPTATPRLSGDVQTAASPTPTPIPVPTPPTTNDIVFDMTQWFQDYPQGRHGQDRQNLGLILLSTTPLTISGDLSSSFSPRFIWYKKTYQ